MSTNLTPKRAISVQTDSVKVESVVRRGQRIPILEMVVTL